MIFLKLGGSLITDKEYPHTPRLDRLVTISQEIQQFLAEKPEETLLIGHGSGSYGHVPAKKFGTRSGVNTPEDWLGFQTVWKEARALNLIVMESLLQAGIPVISFPPSAAIHTTNKKITSWNTSPIQQALANHLVPVIYGDVIFDHAQGGTILSTEELFFHLTPILQPDRILLSGIEAGVWEDYPDRTRIYSSITHTSYPTQKEHILQSGATDVTGGMLSKVENMLQLVQDHTYLTIQIFSGMETGSVFQSLIGSPSGTRIFA